MLDALGWWLAPHQAAAARQVDRLLLFHSTTRTPYLTVPMFEDPYQPTPQHRQSGSHDGFPNTPRWLRRGSPRGVRTVAGSVGVLVVLWLVVRTFRGEFYHDLPGEPWLVPSNSLNFGHPTTLARGAFFRSQNVLFSLISCHSAENLRNDTHYVTSFAQAGFSRFPLRYISIP